MNTELLTPDEWQRIQRIRLTSLVESPDAFGGTLADAQLLTEDDWRRRIAEIPTFIATENGVDLGIACLAEDHADSSAAYLISMWVSPQTRGRRVGEKLIASIISLAQAKSYRTLSLDVADENQSAIALYARMGFEPNGETGTLPEPREHILEHRRVLYL